MGAIRDQLRPPHWKVLEFVQRGDVPDRILREAVRCTTELTDDDDNTVVCGWEGVADVAVWLETGEALFWCPDDHENEWKDA